jgi:hypothetical protein
MAQHMKSEPMLPDLELVACPQCHAPAEVEWRDGGTTEGAGEHLKIRCLHRHWFLLLGDAG